MEKSGELSFGDDSVAGSYEDVLVPILFEPWANALIDAFGPWDGRRVLDLAAGTGIVSGILAQQVGPAGSVLGTDLNAEMLGVARSSVTKESPNVEYVVCPAENLKCMDASFDYVVCQQGGFQSRARQLRSSVCHNALLIPISFGWCIVDGCDNIVSWDLQCGQPWLHSVFQFLSVR